MDLQHFSIIKNILEVKYDEEEDAKHHIFNNQNILKLRDEQNEDIIDQILYDKEKLQDFENKSISKLQYEITDIYLKQENEQEKVEVTPRKRKIQRNLKKIDQILDHVDFPQFSQAKNILKFRHRKTNQKM